LPFPTLFDRQRSIFNGYVKAEGREKVEGRKREETFLAAFLTAVVKINTYPIPPFLPPSLHPSL